MGKSPSGKSIYAINEIYAEVMSLNIGNLRFFRYVFRYKGKMVVGQMPYILQIMNHINQM